MIDVLKSRDFTKEFIFSASRSSGPGGQNVNKLSTKIELRFNISKSSILSDAEKIVISEKLANKINKEGELVIVSQSERSQLLNKEKAIEKFYILITKALLPRKVRKPTKPSKLSKEKRYESKKIQSEKKKRRRRIDL